MGVGVDGDTHIDGELKNLTQRAMATLLNGSGWGVCDNGAFCTLYRFHHD